MPHERNGKQIGKAPVSKIDSSASGWYDMQTKRNGECKRGNWVRGGGIQTHTYMQKWGVGERGRTDKNLSNGKQMEIEREDTVGIGKEGIRENAIESGF